MKPRWKAPDTNLLAAERVILRYLEDEHERGGRELDRCPTAIGRTVFPTGVAPEVRAAAALRKLLLMGLVERYQEYGFVYYKRTPAGEGDSEQEWNEGDSYDIDIFHTAEVCSLMQVLCIKNAMTFKEVADNVMCDGNQKRARDIGEILVRAGYARTNKHVIYLTKKGDGFGEVLAARKNAANVIFEYLKQNQDNPQRCRETNLSVNALNVPPERLGVWNRMLIRPLVKSMIEEGRVYRVKSAAGLFWWLRVPGVETVNDVKTGTPKPPKKEGKR